MNSVYGVALVALVTLALVSEHEATAPLFLQAITSALATIPFTGGPMTTGLVGAKLGIGAKLLYYLGFFGRRSISKPKSISPASTTLKSPGLGATSQFAGGLQPLPLPYMFSGAGRFPQMGGSFGNGFGSPLGFQQQEMQFSGFDPSQLFQALRAQGYDANTAMQILNYGGGFDVNGGGGFGMDGGFDNSGGFQSVQQGALPSRLQASNHQGVPNTLNLQSSSQVMESVSQGDDSDDIESFFTFLKEMDENTCISRLICDIGANPSFLGGFSENIHGIVSSLDVPPTSRAFPYMEIMENGKKEGGCDGRFQQCNDAAYEIVKNVAPSVGVPQNLNPAVINSL